MSNNSQCILYIWRVCFCTYLPTYLPSYSIAYEKGIGNNEGMTQMHNIADCSIICCLAMMPLRTTRIVPKSFWRSQVHPQSRSLTYILHIPDRSFRFPLCQTRAIFSVKQLSWMTDHGNLQRRLIASMILVLSIVMYIMEVLGIVMPIW